MQKTIIQNTVEYVKEVHRDAEGGHDWWHIQRVWHMAKHSAANENVDHTVVELAALLHDIADSKFHNGDESIGPKKAREFLDTMNLANEQVEHIINIIENISFKGGNNPNQFQSKEFDIVQDADRLDAIGAIGIARAFNYGGFKNRSLYDPGIKPNLHMTKTEYKKSTAPTINHFYEKLLLLKERMNTAAGRKIAEERHNFMVQYLDEFFKEWNGER